MVLTIEVADDAGYALLAERLDIWHAIRHPDGTGTLTAQVTPAQWGWLHLLGYETRIDTFQTEQLSRFTAASRQSAAPAQTLPGFACYRTVETIQRDMAQLAVDYPHLARWEAIGQSYDRATDNGIPGYEIHALALSNRAVVADKGRLLVIATIHARELATPELAARFAEMLVDGYGVDPQITWLLDYNEIHIIPMSNPDGHKMAEAGYSWRKNTNNPNACAFPSYGVDLNRNSSFLWNQCGTPGCSSGSPCSILYRGTSPASEPEVQAVEAYIDAFFEDQRGPAITDAAPPDTNGTFISLHSYGNLVVYSWDWTAQNAPNMVELRRLGRKMGYFNGYAVCNTQSCLYPVDGSTTDYAYGTKGVATYTFELGTAFFQSCLYFQNSILQPNLNALLYAAASARRPYQLPAGPDVTSLSLSDQVVQAGDLITLTGVIDSSRYNSNGFGVEPLFPVTGARVSVNGPDWVTGASLEMTPVDGLFNQNQESARAVISTEGWAAGRHTLFVQGQSSNGAWGVPRAIFLWVDAPHDFVVRSDSPSQPVAPGGPASYTLRVRNQAPHADSFVLSAAGQPDGWSVTGEPASLSLSPGAWGSFNVTLTAPGDAVPGEVVPLIVAVHPTGAADAAQPITLTPLITPTQGHVTGAKHQIHLPVVVGE